MNNMTFPDSWGNKTQQHTLVWTPCTSRQPAFDSLFIVTLKGGTVTMDTFSKNCGWTETDVIAWASRPSAYMPNEVKKPQKELADAY